MFAKPDLLNEGCSQINFNFNETWSIEGSLSFLEKGKKKRKNHGMVDDDILKHFQETGSIGNYCSCDLEGTSGQSG